MDIVHVGMHPLNYAQIAADAAKQNHSWAESHFRKLAGRLFIAGLLSEALRAACMVHGLTYEETRLGDGFSLKMADREIRYEWQPILVQITRVSRCGSIAVGKYSQELIPIAPIETIGSAAQAEIAHAVQQLVTGW